MADNMEKSLLRIVERMPEDLRQYVLKTTKGNEAGFPVCEKESANVASEVIVDGQRQIKAYFPVSPPDNEGVVFLHFPGGWPKTVPSV